MPLNPSTRARSRGTSVSLAAETEESSAIRDAVSRYFQSSDHLRRGVCLLNAGQFSLASRAFAEASEINPDSRSLAAMMAACHVGHARYAAAAEDFADAAEAGANDVTNRVRQALALWKDSQPSKAILAFRDALRDHPDSAELHFQLGILLAGLGQTDEAELRFTQSISIDREHTESLVSLALCHAARGEPAQAKKFLLRAQRIMPHDARIAHLLTQAVTALAEQGLNVSVQAHIPPVSQVDSGAIELLSHVVEQEPDFIDAFLLLPSSHKLDDPDREVYSVLARTLHLALNRNPDNPELHCAVGRIHEQLGNTNKAVLSTEEALSLDPALVHGLIQLARLYARTDREDEAVARLEEAIRLGANYADAYYLLGSLYQGKGDDSLARQAYRSALALNEKYEAARQALASLAA